MHYDPMIAKLVVWGENRTAALVKLKDCLAKFQVYLIFLIISQLNRRVYYNHYCNCSMLTHLFLTYYILDEYLY